MEFCFGGRVLPILEVDDVEDVAPRALVAIDTLGLAAALTTVDGGETLWLDSLE